MNLSRNQIIIIGAGGIILLIFILIFTGLLPGLRGGGGTSGGPGELTLWGVFDSQADMQPVFADITTAFGIHIKYKSFNPLTYESELVNALAAGKGPDIFMFHNTWLAKHNDKILPISSEGLSLESLQQLFPTVVEQDFAPDGIIYALPASIDTLALFYNKDIFDQEGVAVPPKNWIDFQNIVRQLRKIDPSTNRIIRAGAAIGGSNKSVNRATDILNNLMLQAGTTMVNRDFTAATFAFKIGLRSPGLESLEFYTQFANPASSYYTWNENFLNSLDAFSQSAAAMTFNYAYQIPLLREKNPFLNFSVVAMPQPSGASQAVNFANYWGYAVSNKSAAPSAAWTVILRLTTNTDTNRIYLKSTNKPPALRQLIEEYRSHSQLGVFARQALTARSWPQIDNARIEEIFSTMIESVINGRLTPEAALFQAQDQISQLMRQRAL